MSLDKWPHKPHDLDVIHIVKESISSHDEDVVVVYVVHLSLSFVGVISASSDLVRKIKSVRLFLRAEHWKELRTFFSNKEVARVSNIARVKNGRFFIDRRDDAGGTSCHFIKRRSFDAELTGVTHVLLASIIVD